MAESSNPRVRKADTAAGPGPAKKAKVTAKTCEPKTNKNSKTTNSHQETAKAAAFAWQEAAEESNAFKRLDTKEEAVRHGLQCAERIRCLLDPIVESLPVAMKNGASTAKELVNWAARLGM